jgi:hypothetical protein
VSRVGIHRGTPTPQRVPSIGILLKSSQGPSASWPGVQTHAKKNPATPVGMTTLTLPSSRSKLFFLEEEFLDAFAGIDFAGVEVALTVGDELVQPVELASVAAVVPELADDGTVFAA